MQHVIPCLDGEKVSTQQAHTDGTLIAYSNGGFVTGFSGFLILPFVTV